MRRKTLFPPARAKKTIPAMSKYHGGVVAGTHVRECGSKPWRATFKIGSRIDKTKTFTDELGAKKWRKKFSNKHGRTTNRWRKHPTLANTVEMLLNRGVSVLFDEDNPLSIEEREVFGSIKPAKTEGPDAVAGPKEE